MKSLTISFDVVVSIWLGSLTTFFMLFFLPKYVTPSSCPPSREEVFSPSSPCGPITILCPFSRVAELRTVNSNLLAYEATFEILVLKLSSCICCFCMNAFLKNFCYSDALMDSSPSRWEEDGPPPPAPNYPAGWYLP